MVLLVAAGSGLRLVQYLGNPDLWLDELAIADNLSSRPALALLSAPLAHDQVAPPGFLLISRMAVVLLGSSEYALRLFPLLCSLAALGLFAGLVWRILEPRPALLATALFCLTPGVALYAAEAKPYAVDVLIALLVTTLALRWREAPAPGRASALAAAGAICLAFSHTAVFVLAGVGAGLLLSATRADRTPVIKLTLLWAAAGALSFGYARGRTDPGLREFMHAFWRNGFMPRPLTSPSDLLWPLTAIRDLFGQLLEYPWPTLYLVVAGLGVLSLLRRRREVALILVFPVLAALLAGVLHAYPFLLRLVLFAVPALLVLVAEGAWRLGTLTRTPAVQSVLLVALAIPPILDLLRRPPVWRRDEVRSMLAGLQHERRPGDSVYVSYFSWQALQYYGPRYGLPLEAVDLGNCYRDPRGFLQELDGYRGQKRVWVLFTFERGRGERQTMLDYLDAIGVRKGALEGLPTNRPGSTAHQQRLVSRPPSTAYLYDLSDLERLASTSARTQPLPTRVEPAWLPSPCGHGPVIPRVRTIPRTDAP